jgi:arsenate reductase
VFCYSGGQKLRHYSLAAKTLEQAGFEVRPLSEGKTRLQHKYSDDAHPIIGFSKTYDDSFNPQSAFAAILTAHKRMAPALIAGAEKRIRSLEDQSI